MASKILLVDDEAKIVELLARYLIRNKFEVIEAVGGAKGLEMLSKEENIDLVITDLKMPEVSGIDVLKECVKKNIKTIVFTASINLAGHRDKLMELNYNLDDVLYKPIDLKVLLEGVKNKLAS